MLVINYCFKIVYLLFIGGIISGCSRGKSNSSENEVKVSIINIIQPIFEFDLNKKYSEKSIILQDIANIEYIALETNNIVLLDDGFKKIITDSLIITGNFQEGSVHIFNRKGSHLHSFNRKGASGEEYTWISSMVFAPLEQELYIQDQGAKYQIMVYTLDGIFKRKLNLPYAMRLNIMYDYDKEWLLCCREKSDKDKGKEFMPFFYLSKKDGNIQVIDYIQKGDVTNYFEDDGFVVAVGSTHPIAENGSEFLIFDFSSDTLFAYKNKIFEPILVRNPIVKDSNIPIIFNLDIRTNNFLIGSYIEKTINKNTNKHTGLYSMFICDYQTKNIYIPRFINKDFISKNEMNLMRSPDMLPPNCMYTLFSPDRLIERNISGKLTGKLKEIAMKLKEDDNPIIMLVNFK